MRRGISWLVVLLISGVACIWLAQPGRAQVTNASLTGLVTDPSGAIVVGATVTAKNNNTNAQYTQKSDSSGYYLFPALPIGPYTVSVEMAGFKKGATISRSKWAR
jgi:hypothetical protein